MVVVLVLVGSMGLGEEEVMEREEEVVDLWGGYNDKSTDANSSFSSLTTAFLLRQKRYSRPNATDKAGRNSVVALAAMMTGVASEE